MYPPGTILALREPQSTDDTIYAYDRVEVVGQSPVQHTTNSGSAWAGADATGFIVRPLSDFAPTLDKPLGQLNELYEVEEWPTDPVTQEPITPESNPLNRPSPEQIFAQVAKGSDQPKRPKRQRTATAQDPHKSPEQLLRESTPRSDSK